MGTERSNPLGMAESIWKGVLSGHLEKTISLPNTAPMFSIEMSHNLYTDAVQAAGPDTSQNTCMARHFGASGDFEEICGTFDGLGAMTYDNLIQTFEHLHQSHGWKVFTIYEWAFVPLKWTNKNRSLVV